MVIEQVKSKDGYLHLIIEGQIVKKITFESGEKMTFPLKIKPNSDEIRIISATGSNQTIIQNSQNVNTGNIITSKSFHLGDK